MLHGLDQVGLARVVEQRFHEVVIVVDRADCGLALVDLLDGELAASHSSEQGLERVVDGEERDLLGLEDVLRQLEQHLHGGDGSLKPFLEEGRHLLRQPLRLADFEHFLVAIEAEREQTLRRVLLLGAQRSFDADIPGRFIHDLPFLLFVESLLVAAAEEVPDHLLALFIGGVDALQAGNALLLELPEEVVGRVAHLWVLEFIN